MAETPHAPAPPTSPGLTPGPRRDAEQRWRASEERLRLLIDSATDYALFTMSDTGVIDSWNPGAERVFGYTANEIIGQHAAIVFTPEDRAAGIPGQELESARRDGRASDERWHVRKDGSRLYVSGVMTRLGEGLGFAKIARDLTPRREAQIALEEAHVLLEQRVAERTEQLQLEILRRANAQEDVTALLRKLVTAQEDERARIARDLHDQLGQQLTALRLALERHRARCVGGAGEDLDRAQELAREIDRAVDFLAWELRPTILDDLGLAAALRRYVEEWSAQSGISAEFHGTLSVAGQLSAEAEMAFYRVAQEALNNTSKHAEATRVDVVLERRGGEAVLTVDDDGMGFDVEAPETKRKGVGIIGMRERAALVGGTLQVESTAGRGTTVYLRCPVTPAEARPAGPAPSP
jgi:PAS domain S-box-containing protein